MFTSFLVRGAARRPAATGEDGRIYGLLAKAAFFRGAASPYQHRATTESTRCVASRLAVRVWPIRRACERLGTAEQCCVLRLAIEEGIQASFTFISLLQEEW